MGGAAGTPATGGAGGVGTGGGAGSPPVIAPFDDIFVWNTITFDNATFLGHTPSATTPTPTAPVIDLDLYDTIQLSNAGLGNAVGGGNSHGVGIGFFDVNADGFDDIFVANGTSNSGAGQTNSLLYLNDGDGTFTDVTSSSGIAAILDGLDTYSVAGGDYDNDGDIDMYVGTHPTDILIANQGNGTFVVSAHTGYGGPPTSSAAASDGRSKIVSFGDFDNDGWLDLVSVTNTGNDVYLLRNDRAGNFTDITVSSGIETAPSGNPCALMWTDYDNDADYDLWIWNDRGGRRLLRNEIGSNTFTNITTSPGNVDAEANIGNPMGIDGADIDHDGDLDYYISNLGSNNPLLRNDGNGSTNPADWSFTNIATPSGTRGDFGWGLGFEDFDHDTWADIFIAQEGSTNPANDRPYQVFQNTGQVPSAFNELQFPHAPLISNAAHNVAVAFADFDHDGRTDVVSATTDGSAISFYRNITNVGNRGWLEVTIPRVPVTGERGGIGARVIVKTPDLVQFRDINGGSSRASQNAHSVRFGLGNWDGAEWVAAIWPDGRQLVVTGVPGNRRIEMP